MVVYDIENDSFWVLRGRGESCCCGIVFLFELCGVGSVVEFCFYYLGVEMVEGCLVFDGCWGIV